MIMSILQIRELNLIKGSSGYLIVESQTQARMSSKLLFLITIPQGAGEGHRPLKRSTVLSLSLLAKVVRVVPAPSLLLWGFERWLQPSGYLQSNTHPVL